MEHLSYFTAILYLGLAITQLSSFVGKFEIPKVKMLILSFVTICLHGYLLYRWIDTEFGQNLSISNLFSLIIWLISNMAIIASFKKKMENLLLLIFPVASLSILYVVLVPSYVIVQTRNSPAELAHIFLVITTSSLLGLAGLQALFLSMHNWMLKKPAYYGLSQSMPALENIEQVLFKLMAASFIALTISWLSAHIFLPKTSNIMGLTKFGCVYLSWSILAGLLLGRRYLGWRGAFAAKGTLLSLALLSIAFLMNKIWIE